MELGPCARVHVCKEGSETLVGAVWQKKANPALIVTTDHRVVIYEVSQRALRNA
jgi:hypothetical protein